MSDLKQAEEARREHMRDTKDRWEAIRAALNWAARQPTAPKFDPASRIREQNRKMRELAS